MHVQRIKFLRLIIVIGVFSSLIILLIYSLPNNDKDTNIAFNHGLFDVWPFESTNIQHINARINLVHLQPIQLDRINTNHQINFIRNKIKRRTVKRMQIDDTQALINVTKQLPKHSTKNIHIFYTLPVEWSQETTAFYPLLGFYMSDNRTIRHHFKNIQQIGANILIITWSPQCREQMLYHIFDEALHFGIHIAIEIDNYNNRTVYSIYRDIQYFYREFWQHESLYKVFVASKGIYMPMFYIKAINQITVNDWKKLFLPNGEITLRNYQFDAVFIGHIGSRTDVSIIKISKFNGFYSRMVSNGATYASTWKYWSELKKSADKFKLLFIPTVGPGYDDNSRQSNIARTRRHRTNGQYYGVAWRAAMRIRAQFINIASYNDWLSGTQIEEAISKSGFKDYTPGTPTKYIDLTRYWINEFIQLWRIDAKQSVAKNETICNSYFNNTIC